MGLKRKEKAYGSKEAGRHIKGWEAEVVNG